MSYVTAIHLLKESNVGIVINSLNGRTSFIQILPGLIFFFPFNLFLFQTPNQDTTWHFSLPCF